MSQQFMPNLGLGPTFAQMRAPPVWWELIIINRNCISTAFIYGSFPLSLVLQTAGLIAGIMAHCLSWLGFPSYVSKGAGTAVISLPRYGHCSYVMLPLSLPLPLYDSWGSSWWYHQVQLYMLGCQVFFSASRWAVGIVIDDAFTTRNFLGDFIYLIFLIKTLRKFECFYFQYTFFFFE